MLINFIACETNATECSAWVKLQNGHSAIYIRSTNQSIQYFVNYKSISFYKDNTPELNSAFLLAVNH